MKTKNTIKALALGIIAAIVAMFLELSLLHLPQEKVSIFSDSLEVTLPFLIVAAIIEELLKLFFIFKAYKDLNDKNQIIGSSLALGAGFFIIEFLLRQSSFESLFLMQFFGVLLVHLLTSLIAGTILFKKKTSSIPLFLQIMLVITVIHIAYNFLIYRFS